GEVVAKLVLVIVPDAAPRGSCADIETLAQKILGDVQSAGGAWDLRERRGPTVSPEIARIAEAHGVESSRSRGRGELQAEKTLHDGAQAQTARIEALHCVAAHHSAGVDELENALAQRIGRNRAGDGRGLRQPPALIVGEEKSLVAPHRTAHRAAESIVPEPL